MSVPDSIKQLIERMLVLQKQHPSTPGEKTMLEREIAATYRQIDALVYDSPFGDLAPCGMISQAVERLGGQSRSGVGWLERSVI